MKLAVSNIAWRNEEEVAAAELLRDLGVKNIELAPTKIWHDPTRTTMQQALQYRDFWDSYGIEVVAFQSMLFNRPDLHLFTKDTRKECENYLSQFVQLAGVMGVTRMVFGSPKNRQRGNLSKQEADSIARDFFIALAEVAEQNGVVFCIEPNAPQYACNYITTAQEGIDFVRSVARPGIGLHLDTGCMNLVGDDICSSIRNAGQTLSHYHVSSPMLEAVNSEVGIDHTAAADALREINYEGFISIEMKPQDTRNLSRVYEAIMFTKESYDIN
ncbi:MAG: sugar phosphate isomerase/epimerase [Ferruginibacter sp.]